MCGRSFLPVGFRGEHVFVSSITWNTEKFHFESRDEFKGMRRARNLIWQSGLAERKKISFQRLYIISFFIEHSSMLVYLSLKL